MCFAGARVSDQQDVLPCFQIFPAKELTYQEFVDGGLGRKVKTIDGL